MNIVRVHRKANFKDLRPLWNQLLSESGSDNIFLTWEWLFHWWEAFADTGDELCILLGIEEGKIIAIAPLYLRKGHLKEIRFLGSGIVCSEYLSFICRPQDAETFARRVYEYLLKNRTKWDILSLEGTLAGDSMIAVLKRMSRADRMSVKIPKKHRCFYLPLRKARNNGAQKESIDRHRTKLNQKKRKLGRKGTLGFEHTDGQPYPILCAKYKNLISLHQNRWKQMECKEGGLFDNKLFRKFIDKITAVFYDNRWLNVSLLTLDEKAVAAYYSFTFNGKIFGYLTGFEPAYKNCSPGALCLWESLNYFREKGYTEFDFLRGDEDYKRDWSEHYRTIEDVVIAQQGMRTCLYMRGRETFGFLKEIARKIISPRLFASLRAIKFRKSR